ncbi:MAG: SusD/RagB family nutrient-binding outer membrane lipoprotein [Cytophagales bacterium]|nr:SusD/RagB family nutrient-binding outer membrane lipoprotein [Bernardetiaceae bacterium]MDW8211702.1 SusD/RagB family nutrient-binding outer membrane lipoprotein [Cytophagales bacterium]
MLKHIRIIALAIVLMLLNACKLDLLDNPNAVTLSNANPNFLLNRIQLDFATFFNQASDPGMRLTRMLNQGAAVYANAYTPQNLDALWTNAYANILIDAKTLIEIAERSNLPVHAGIARVIRAYVLATLVDYFGEVPFSESLDANNFNPKVESGEAIYRAALADLDRAIANFGASAAAVPTDFFYRGNRDNWIRAANTIKLKLLLNTRLVNPAAAASAINALIADGRLITTGAQSMMFRFSSNLANPDSRHPRYAGQYSPTGGGDYQSNFYMWTLVESKGFPDPRTRFYFYRQVTRNTRDVNELRCINNQPPAHYPPGMPYCFGSFADLGYWGRDHLNNEGIPPDGLRRTAWGLYPAGGRFDDDRGQPVALIAGAQGAGIHPIMMSSFTDFMLAEAALTLRTTGNPRALLESAVRKSMADVRNYALSTIEGSVVTAFEAARGINWDNEVNRYVNRVLQLYDAATNDDERLDVVLREYWIALYGNGIESYNMYRRTGKPSGMQPALEPNPGAFIRSFFYPAVHANRNSNAKQKTNVEVPVFWDKNPPGFVR